MKPPRLNRAMRFFFFVTDVLLWTGILLTGVRTVHVVLYVPAVFFLFAALTGICPGLILSNRLVGGQDGRPPKTP